MNNAKNQASMLIENLLQYGLKHKIILKSDVIYTRNLLLDLLKIDEPLTKYKKLSTIDIPEYPTPILEKILDYCSEQGLLEDNTLTYRDLMDTKIMGLLMPKPSEVETQFNTTRKSDGIKAATDYFYALCQKTDYIRMERIARNLKWGYNSPYGNLEITINLTKPEKDPREIAALKNVPQSGYPKCLLCPENSGYAGRVNHPARQTLRTIPLTLKGEHWFFQYSPYVYYNEHCIVLFEEHVPMKINRDTFVRLMDFLDELPHYFIGSNADLPIVGGSILNHDHFQGGSYVFPMEKAQTEYSLINVKYPYVEAFVVNWPMSVIRLRSSKRESLITLADELLAVWREYTDESVDVLAYSIVDGNKIPHNTITPIARRTNDGLYEMDLVFRNNRTSEEHPMGIFHPHEDLHHVKKENIGLIEVMGLFILPGRLENELAQLFLFLTGKQSYDKSIILDNNNPISKHLIWLKELISKYGTNLTADVANKVLQSSVGMKCQRVLEDAGVFKTGQQGRAAFNKFLNTAGFELS